MPRNAAEVELSEKVARAEALAARGADLAARQEPDAKYVILADALRDLACALRQARLSVNAIASVAEAVITEDRATVRARQESAMAKTRPMPVLRAVVS